MTVAGDADHMHRLHDAFELHQPEIMELQLGHAVHEPGGQRRQHDLATVGRGHDPRGTIERRPEIVAVAFFGVAGVDAHPHTQHRATNPHLGRKRPLRGQRRFDRRPRPGKHRDETVTTGRNHMTAGPTDRRTNNLVMTGQRRAHRIRKRIPQRRRTHNVGKQKRHRPCRQLRPPATIGHFPTLIPGRNPLRSLVRQPGTGPTAARRRRSGIGRHSGTELSDAVRSVAADCLRLARTRWERRRYAR